MVRKWKFTLYPMCCGTVTKFIKKKKHQQQQLQQICMMIFHSVICTYTTLTKTSIQKTFQIEYLDFSRACFIFYSNVWIDSHRDIEWNLIPRIICVFLSLHFYKFMFQFKNVIRNCWNGGKITWAISLLSLEIAIFKQMEFSMRFFL